MDPHSFCADPDQSVLLNADPDPTAFLIRIRIQQHKIINKLPESFLELKKKKNIAQKKKDGPDMIKKLLTITTNYFFIFSVLSFSLLDSDPGGKMDADPDPQPWLLSA